MLNRPVTTETPIQAANRALRAVHGMARTLNLTDEAFFVMDDAAKRLEDLIIEAPINGPSDIAEKFRFLADKIDRAQGGPDIDEADCLAIFTRQLADLRRCLVKAMRAAA